MDTTLLHAEDISRALTNLASQIRQRHGDCKNILLVGIQRRGADIARRLVRLLEESLGAPLRLGTLDINLYRDDWTSLAGKPQIGQSVIPQPVDKAVVILVDDVLYTGRTIRAALEALLDYGRPHKVELLVLVDRGLRELPIHPDYVGHTVDTQREERVDVLLVERDGKDAVRLSTPALVR